MPFLFLGSEASFSFINLIASGLLLSMPIIIRFISKYFATANIPSITRSEFSSISLWSAVIYGSHSAALINKVSTGFGGFTFTWVGKPPPPRPTKPDSLIAFTKSSLE